MFNTKFSRALEPRTSRHLATGFFAPRTSNDFVHFVGSQFRDPNWMTPPGGRDNRFSDFLTHDILNDKQLDDEGNINYYKGNFFRHFWIWWIGVYNMISTTDHCSIQWSVSALIIAVNNLGVLDAYLVFWLDSSEICWFLEFLIYFELGFGKSSLEFLSFSRS